MRRTSTLVRLALALLALLGPAAPAVVRQVDAVAQAAGPGPERAPTPRVTVASARVVEAWCPATPDARDVPQGARARGAPPGRRFLWHHAWLN